MLRSQWHINIIPSNANLEGIPILGCWHAGIIKYNLIKQLESFYVLGNINKFHILKLRQVQKNSCIFSHVNFKTCLL